MKEIFLLLASACLAHLASAAVTPPTSSMHLFLLIGQSNMAGRGPVGDMSDPDKLVPL